MDKGKIKEKMSQLEETYKEVDKKIQELEQQKLRLEGQYSAYNDMLEDDKKTLEVEDD